MKGFWSTFYNCELCTYVGFSMMILQQTWFLEVMVVFLDMETKELVFCFLILREMWSTFNKNSLLRRLEV
jgi:hypothetical protein